VPPAALLAWLRRRRLATAARPGMRPAPEELGRAG
jgi:hypothetical protein